MHVQEESRHKKSRLRRVVSAVAALALGLGLAVTGTSPAYAVTVGISIQATGPTTQPSGSTFTYQINLACAGTNAPSCKDAIVTVPLDSVSGMSGWDYDVTGGPTGFIQGWQIVGDDLVVTLEDTISAGTSQSIVLSVTPPNLVTPDGTSWSLLPSVSSTDPDMTDSTAPAAANGTATATVPLTVGKTSDRTFYAEGETLTYTLRATCPASKPVGSVHAASMIIRDTLPAGLTFDSATPAPTNIDAGTGELTWSYADPTTVPLACGGTAGTAAADTITVTTTVGTVGTGSDFAPYENVDNTVQVSATPVGGGDSATAESTRTVVMLGSGDNPIPGTHSLGKSSNAALNRAGSGSSDMRATYPGRWLPNGDNSARPASVLEAAPARYTISPRIQYESFQYEIRDKLPCLADRDGSGVYTASIGVCAAPAFHVLGIRIDYSGAAPAPAYAPQYTKTDGSGPLPMDFETSGSTWAGWVVPAADLGSVAEIVIPRDVSQEQRRSDNIRVYGFADASTNDGETLQNQASIDWFLRADTTPIDSQTSPAADVYILNSPQVGVTKSMSPVGDVTGTQSRLALSATLFTPGVPTADLVIADLLPAGTSLATDTSSITATLVRPGAANLTFSSAQLVVEVIGDHAPGRDLLRISLPQALLPAEAGKFTLTPSILVVDKPDETGTYLNQARVFYDTGDLLPMCAAGDYSGTDPNGIRPTNDAVTGNCVAQATFRTVTSSSGQFLLTKTVQGDKDTFPQTFPAVGHVKLEDGLADYAITWRNTGAPDLESVVLYDILPHVGDTGVSQAQAGEQRGSQFRPVLDTVGALPSGITASFSASADPCRPEVYPSQNPADCINDWTTDPTTIGGLDNVLSLRLVGSGSYRTGEGFSIDFRMSVPTVDKDQLAWNSVAAFAQSTSGTALLPTESPKVGITASDDRFTLDKKVDADHAVPGDTLDYTVTVGNTGTKDSVATTVTDRLPRGVTFASADNGGSYEAASRTVSWSVPAMPRDTTFVGTVTVTVDTVQAADEIVNRATIVTPPGYSSTVVGDPCADDPTSSCARTGVPASALSTTGSDLTPWAAVAGISGLVAGGIMLLVEAVRRRRSA